jgi:hypothetical protein
MLFPVGRFKPMCARQYVCAAVIIDIADGNSFRNEVFGQGVLLKLHQTVWSCLTAGPICQYQGK